MDDVYYIEIFEKMLDQNEIPHAELFVDDRLHMNEKGYAIWSKEILKFLS